MKRATKNIFFLLLGLLGLIYSISSGRGITGTLEGKVRDKDTGEPVPGVAVIVIGSGIECTTDSLGRYQITGIRTGVYDVRFQIIGYQTKTIIKVTILPDFKTHIDVTLKQSSVEMDPIEIRAEHSLIQKDKAASAYQYSGSQMNLLPISRLNEAITLMPGVTREGNVRGGRTNEVIYLLDGIPIQDVISGGSSIELPKNTVGAMTMWTGGFDAEFGNALSGVVNIVSQSASPTHQFEVRYERDHWLAERQVRQTDKEDEIELFASGPIIPGTLSYLTTNTYSISDTRWWQDFRYFFPSPILKNFTGLTRFEYVPTPATRLVLQGIYSLQRWRDYEYRWRYNLAGLPQREKDLYRGTAMFTHTLSPHSFYTATLGYSTQRSHIGPESKDKLTLMPYQYDLYLRFIVSGSKNWWAETKQDIFTLKGDYTLQAFSFHTFKAGAELNQYTIYGDIIKYEPQVTYFGKPILDAPMLNYSNFYQYHPRMGSVFIQDKMEFTTDGAMMNFGFRWDFLDPAAQRPIVEYIPTNPDEYQQHVTGKVHTTVKHQISPRFSFTMPIGPDGYLFANYGRYVQFPLFDYLYSGITLIQLEYGAKNVLAGNPDLEPERMSAWELGVKQLLKNNWAISATYFQKKITNQIDAKTLVPFDSKFSGDYGYAAYVNLDEAYAEGFEIVLTHESSEWLNGFISYTNMSTEGLSEQANQNITIAQWGFAVPAYPYPLSWDQRHTVKMNLDAKLPFGIDADLYAEYHSPRPYTFYPTKDGFVPLDTSKPFFPNNRRMFEVYTIDLKIQKTLQFHTLFPFELRFYVDIRNLLNTKNVLWIDSNNRTGGELEDPSAYSTPRRVRVGIQLQF
jgi:outer membrane receptor for ferrienterochelin and colicin